MSDYDPRRCWLTTCRRAERTQDGAAWHYKYEVACLNDDSRHICLTKVRPL